MIFCIWSFQVSELLKAETSKHLTNWNAVIVLAQDKQLPLALPLIWEYQRSLRSDREDQ